MRVQAAYQATELPPQTLIPGDKWVNDIIAALSRPAKSEFSPRELLARDLCQDDGKDPDFCLDAEIRDVGNGMCAFRCKRYAWEDYLAAADEFFVGEDGLDFS
jgi:hypothetical protein